MPRLLLAFVALVFAVSACPAAAAGTGHRTRIAVVDSYHPAYLWSQDTNRGVVAGLLKFGYLDNAAQGKEYTRNFFVRSSRAVVKKLWMDTKHKHSKSQIEHTVARIVKVLAAFHPDILLLGDDNAANYLGNYYMDTKLPVVFWGINGSPLKYNLLDSIRRPGHNVTGIYQAGYLREGVVWLTRLLPNIHKIAVLSDASVTGRSKAREVERLARRGELPVKVVAVVVTNSLQTWKAKALELAPRVDGFVVLNHNTLKDAAGHTVDQLTAGAWYLRHVMKPGVAQEKQFVEEGILCAVDDSGFKQGYEAVRIAHRILADGEKPADIPVYAPSRGPFVVNMERARMLGLSDIVAASPLVEERIPRALALHR